MSAILLTLFCFPSFFFFSQRKMEAYVGTSPHAHRIGGSLQVCVSVCMNILSVCVSVSMNMCTCFFRVSPVLLSLSLYQCLCKFFVSFSFVTHTLSSIFLIVTLSFCVYFSVVTRVLFSRILVPRNCKSRPVACNNCVCVCVCVCV